MEGATDAVAGTQSVVARSRRPFHRSLVQGLPDEHTTRHAATYGGKPWCYALLRHDAIAENFSLDRLVASGAAA